MSSQPETPHEQLIVPPVLVRSQNPKARIHSIFNPAECAPSPTQPDQSNPGAEPGNDDTIDDGAGQNRNGGGKVSNLKSLLQVHKC